MTKKLYRSKENRVLAGVLGGVAEYFEIDAVLPRLMFTLITLATGVVPAVIVYIVAVIVVPEKEMGTHHEPIHIVATEHPTEERKATGDDISAV